MPQLDRGAHDDRAVVVQPHLHHERLVDLQLVRLDAAQVGQRGVAGAVVVDRQADAGRAQPAEHLEGPLRVGHDRALGDLDGQPGRRDAVPLEHVGHEDRQVEVGEQPGGDVDGHRQVVALVAQPAQRGDGLLDPPAAEPADQSAVLGERDEHVRAHQAVPRVQPAAESLDREDVSGAGAHLRLEGEDELVVVDRAVQVTEQRQPLDGVAVDLGPVGLDLAAVGLGPVERDVRALEQRLERVGVLRGDRDADAGLDTEPHAVDDHRLAQPDGEVGRHLACALPAVDVGEQDGELVAAEPGHRDVLARDVGQPLGHLADHHVTDVVTHRVVDLLEVVQVDEHHRHRVRRVRRRRAPSARAGAAARGWAGR